MLEIHGHCMCSAVTFTASEKPIWTVVCHCSDCRRSAGNALAVFAIFKESSFSLIKGELKSFESSPGVQRSFCPQCGTPIAYRSARIPKEIHVLIGALDQPEDYPPQMEVYCQEQLPWVDLALDGPKFQVLPEKRPLY